MDNERYTMKTLQGININAVNKETRDYLERIALCNQHKEAKRIREMSLKNRIAEYIIMVGFKLKNS